MKIYEDGEQRRGWSVWFVGQTRPNKINDQGRWGNGTRDSVLDWDAFFHFIISFNQS